jgi:hypothetical protein
VVFVFTGVQHYAYQFLDSKSINGREMKEEIEGIKVVIRIRKSKKDRQPNDQEKNVQRDKQRSTKNIHRKLTIEKLKPL